MNSPTAIAFTGFVVWALLLLLLMETLRTRLVLTKKIVANGFVPDNANLSPFMQRLARAHANCVEGLPIFGGLMLVAIVLERTELTNGLAYFFLAARVVQSLIHLASLSPMAVSARFTAFAVQLGISVYWSFGLLRSLLT